MISAVTCRIAFVAPANPLSEAEGGGPARYLWRMSEALRAHGHEVEIFAPHNTSSIESADGVRVHLVGCRESDLWASQGQVRRLRDRVLRKLGLSVLSEVAAQLALAGAIARAVEARHAERPFDIIQSNSYRLVGARIKRRPDRTHVIRCSSSRYLCNRVDGTERSVSGRLREACENWFFRQVDGVYAPSQLVAQLVQERAGVKAGVVRPPLAASDLAWATREDRSERYLLHFGQIGRRKGSDCVVEAVRLAWKQCPDLQMKWAGPCRRDLRYYEGFFRGSDGRVRWLGELPRAQLFPLIVNAESCVLPSRADNLPNSVIESLMLGTPVIGFRAASVDEIVEPGINGQLVDYEDVAGLAQAMVDVWQRRVPWIGTGFQHPAIFDRMTPAAAVSEWLAFVRSVQTTRG